MLPQACLIHPPTLIQFEFRFAMQLLSPFYRFPAPIGAMVKGGLGKHDPETKSEPDTIWPELPGALC